MGRKQKMTAQHNPDECARLIAEARKDDERMSDAPWSFYKHGSMGPDTYVIEGSTIQVPYADAPDARGIARTRNNLRAMADQLEAAQAEIQRLNDHVLIEVAEERDEARSEAEQLRTLVQALRFDTEQRDKLRASLDGVNASNDRLTAEIVSMRPVVEAAEGVRDKRREVSKGMRKPEELKVELHELSERVDAYRAARDKAGQRAAYVPPGPSDYVCTVCGETMTRYEDFEEYQHSKCGGLVERAAQDKAGG